MSYRLLADAIRRGAKMRPQGFGSMQNQLAFGTSCALLAAIEGLYGWPKSYHELCELHPYQSIPLAEDIFRKNDINKMTREAIADWVDSLADPLEPKAAAQDETAGPPYVSPTLVGEVRTPAAASPESDSDWASRKVAEVTRVKEAA